MYGEHRVKQYIFIVPGVNDPRNNFSELELILLGEPGMQEYRLPRLPVPLIRLKLLLVSLDRNKGNPRCDCESGKLRKLGIKNPLSLSDKLVKYATWYRASYLEAGEAKAA